jgi:hypothetical protein
MRTLTIYFVAGALAAGGKMKAMPAWVAKAGLPDAGNSN